MNKIKKDIQLEMVKNAEAQVVKDIGRRIYAMLGRAQQLELIQEKLPKKPIFCKAKTAELLRNEKH